MGKYNEEAVQQILTSCYIFHTQTHTHTKTLNVHTRCRLFLQSLVCEGAWMTMCWGTCLSVSRCSGWYGLYHPCRLGSMWTGQEEGEIRFPQGEMEGREDRERKMKEKGVWRRKKQMKCRKPGKIRHKCDIRERERSSERWETAR